VIIHLARRTLAIAFVTRLRPGIRWPNSRLHGKISKETDGVKKFVLREGIRARRPVIANRGAAKCAFGFI